MPASVDGDPIFNFGEKKMSEEFLGNQAKKYISGELCEEHA